MSTIHPLAVGYARPNVEHHSISAGVLSPTIDSLTAFKDVVEVTHVKAVFESVVAILTLARVGFLVLFQFLHPLIGDTARTR